MKERNDVALRVIFAGGGTGGHIYPGVAMYEQLSNRRGGVEAIFVGARGGVEETIFSSMALRHELFPGRGLRGASLARKLTTPFIFADAVRRAVSIIRRFHPDVVVGTGGYASAAAVVAAVLLGIPRVLQEQNSVPGLVNRRLGRFADLVLLSFDVSKRYFPASVRVESIGNPTRRLAQQTREEGAATLGLDPTIPTVLVIGGSRGAHSLNVAGAGAVLRILESRDIQAVLLTGGDDYKPTREQFGGKEGRIKVTAYLDDPGAAYAAADVAVARAGASVVFELAAFGVPTVFVPYPWAADDHQALNIAALVEKGNAVAIEDGRLSSDVLAETLLRLIDDEPRRADMSSAMKQWAKPEAAGVAAELIAEVVKKKLAGEPRRRVAVGH